MAVTHGGDVVSDGQKKLHSDLVRPTKLNSNDLRVCQMTFGWTLHFHRFRDTCAAPLNYTILLKKMNNLSVGGSCSAIFIPVRMKDIKYCLD